jgi:apolipoprotein N-acyltransferase
VSPSRRDLLLAAASGLALGAAFPPLPLGVLAWAAFVPLLVALDRRVGAGLPKRALFALGWAGGFVFFLAGTHWIALLSDVAITVPWLKYLGWLLSAAYLANYWALATLLAGVLARRAGMAARWTFVPVMVLVEELRGSGELGFPWFQPGYTQHALPTLGLAALGGVMLVTLWLLALNSAGAAAWRSRTARGAAPFLLLLALGLSAGALSRGTPAPRSGPAPVVALVQADIPGAIKWAGTHQQEILEAYLALSDSALAVPAGTPRPQLVVWSETAVGSYMRLQLDQSLAVAHWAASRGVPVFAGYADATRAPDGTPLPWNAAGQWNADGSLSERYAKRHLVPFGERMPFQWLVPSLGKVDLGQAEWQPGTRSVLFPGPAGPFSCLVCFESIFPDLARADVRAGSRLLVNITNDEWFGNSAALYQHAAMAPFRAVENGVPLVRCANNGLTEVIGPDGRVTARAPVFLPTVLRAAVPAPRAGRTPWSRFGDWPGALAAAGVVALLFARRPAAT